MKKEYTSKLKRAISGILALTMTASLTSVMPATADTPIEPVSRTYSGDGYEVRYDVTGGWADNRNVQVTLTNTGDEPLQNWALKYDVQGEIVNIWNGTVAASGDDWSIVKNNGYNYDIQPKSSTSFGYIVNGNDSTLPETIGLCTERKEVAEDNYTVKLNVDSDWGSGFTGSFSIENLGDTPIEAWRLSFDNNFVIENTWNADIYSAEGNRYTVANAYATAFINPHETVSFGFRGTKENDVIPEISNVSLSAVTINADIKTEVTVSDSSESSLEDSSSESSSENTDSDSSEDSSVTDSSSTSADSSSVPDSQPDDSSIPDEEPEDELSDALSIFAYGHYNNEEKAIDIDWYTETKGEYTVLESDDNIDYSEVITVSDFSDYRYHIAEPFDTKYFKVKVTSSKKYAESVPFEVKRTADGYDVAFIDTDGDGIADAREDELGTDKNKADTDDDGVSDYDELCLINSDPLVYDSITEGVSDKYADSDEDGLSNYEEIKLGTSPMFDDTDSDGLKDGEEVNTYKTDPFNKDTDKDGLTDYEEVTLGTDPLKASSDGKTPDSQRTSEQKLGIEAAAFEDINTEDNPFKVSMDITAAGIAYDNLEAKKSGYSNAIQSDAVFGTVPEFTYTDGLNVEAVTLKFGIDDEYIANTNGKYAEVSDDFAGIKRFSVFKYFEELDMLLPIKTTYDLDSNTVITKVDELGTYCLIDMEVWLESLEIEPEKLETITISGGPISMVGITVNKSLFMASAAAAELPDYGVKNIDVVFSLFLKREKNGSNNNERIKAQIIEAGNLLFDKYSPNGNVHIYVTDYKGGVSKYKDTNICYASNSAELEELISHIGANYTTNTPLLETAVCNFFDQCSLRANADKFYVAVQSDVVECVNKSTLKTKLETEKLNLSIVTNLFELRELADYSGGLFHQGVYNYREPITEHIIKFVGLNDQGKVYKTITSSGLKTIALEADITPDYKELSEQELTEEQLSNYADQDEDGLPDFKELRYVIDGKDVITWDSTNAVELKSFNEYFDLPSVKDEVENGLKQYTGLSRDFFDDIKVLPIWSDPTLGDSDYDKIFDSVEIELGTNPLSWDTDGDKLSDYTEVMNYYDPLDRDPDGDGFSDWAEFTYDMDPYVFDISVEKKILEFLEGFAAGALEEVDTLPQLMGQLAGCCLGIAGDIRDFIANLAKGKILDASINLVGIIPAFGDACAAAGVTGKFILSHLDDSVLIVSAVSYVIDKCPTFVKFLKAPILNAVSDVCLMDFKASRKVVQSFGNALVKIGNLAENPSVRKLIEKADLVQKYLKKAKNLIQAAKDIKDFLDNGLTKEELLGYLRTIFGEYVPYLNTLDINTLNILYKLNELKQDELIEEFLAVSEGHEALLNNYIDSVTEETDLIDLIDRYSVEAWQEELNKYTSASGSTSNKRTFTDEELIQAAYDINYAQYGDMWYKAMNPICVTVATDGTIVVSKNSGTPGPKSRVKAREIFGDDVRFANGIDANYDCSRWGHTTAYPHHAEARGMQYLEKNGISPDDAIQATTLLSCKECANLQNDYTINNISGRK